MSHKRLIATLAIVTVVAAGLAGAVMAQQGGGGGRGGAGGAGGPGGGFDPAAMRERMSQRSQRMREMLGATEEEWQALWPLVEKVQNLTRQVRGGAMGGMMGGMMGRGGERGGAAPAGEQTEVDRATQELRAVLENQNAPADQIRARLTALRNAREKAKQELEKAQQQLRQVVTVRQEAQLVLMGLLE